MKSRLVATLSLAVVGLVGIAQAEDQKPAAPSAKSAAAAPAVAPAKTNAAPATTAPATAAPATSSASATKPAAKEQYIVIGYLEKRDGTVITIKSGPQGPAYSVASKDGKVLFDNLSSEQLRAKAPEIHEFIKTGVAIDSDAKSVKKDARLVEGRL
jgi:hypothetical protein